MSNNLIWHPASELPPLHEESFEDDGTVYKSLLSNWVLVRDEACADSNGDPYTAPVRVAHYVKWDNGFQWEDGGGRCREVTHWMPLPEPPEVGNHG